MGDARDFRIEAERAPRRRRVHGVQLRGPAVLLGLARLVRKAALGDRRREPPGGGCGRGDRRGAPRRCRVVATGRSVRSPGDPDGSDGLEQHSAWSIQQDVAPYALLKVVDAGDAPIVPARSGPRSARDPREGVPRRGRRARSRSCSAAITRSRTRAPPRSRGSSIRGSVGIVHFDAHADTGAEQWGSLVGHGTPMRRLIEEGWIAGPNFVQVGLRGYWPEKETFGLDARARASAGIPWSRSRTADPRP